MFRYIPFYLLAVLLVACSPASTGGNPAPRTRTPLPSPTPTAESLPTATTEPAVSSEQAPFPLLYASDREGKGALYRREASGETQRLTDPAEIPAWQPAIDSEGRRILFTGRRNGQSDIALIAADGSDQRWITTHDADDHSPVWSPDGRYIAWVSERDESSQVWFMRNEEDATPRSLPRYHGERLTRTPAWEPAGTLLYAGLNEEGVEAIYRWDPETEAVDRLLDLPLRGRHPAAGPDGEIVFVGWEGISPRRGLYRLRPDGESELLWETTDWIGDPAWSADGRWILFTRWRDDGWGHDLWALPAEGGEPRRVTRDAYWVADAEPWPTGTGALPVPAGEQEAVQVEKSRLALGFNVANVDNARISRDLGFGWAKGYAFWNRIEQAPGEFNWVEVDQTIERFEAAGMKVLLRVDRTPAWARPEGTSPTHPPTDLEAYARFLQTLAERYRGRVAAYELWNEPNLAYEWGHTYPDPAHYVEMLRAARPALQRGDPDAKLVVGALAVTTTDGKNAMGDLEWMERFYEALGEVDSHPYDAFATHPYGFGRPPDQPPDSGIGLRRLEAQRAVMEAWGDDSPMWLTELGYARHTPAWDLGEHEQWAVSDEEQARYLVASLDWIEENYPYVEAVFPFNLDFSVVDWYPASEQMRAYAILDSARRPLPAFTRLRQRALGQLP